MSVKVCHVEIYSLVALILFKQKAVTRLNHRLYALLALKAAGQKLQHCKVNIPQSQAIQGHQRNISLFVLTKRP